VQDAVLDRVVFPGELPGVLVDRNDRRRFRGRNVHVTFILSVRGADEHQIAEGDKVVTNAGSSLHDGDRVRSILAEAVCTELR
jgi:hypothetical protein